MLRNYEELDVYRDDGQVFRAIDGMKSTYSTTSEPLIDCGRKWYSNDGS